MAGSYVLSAVIWHNRYWDERGRPYGYAGGHENHFHTEFPGTPGVVVGPGNDSYDACVLLGNWMRRRSMRPGEHPAFDRVDPVHHGRGHYDHRAIDGNFGPAGANNIERAAFDALIPGVLRRGVDVRRLVAPAPPKELLDMADPVNYNFFNLKFAELQNNLGALGQLHHDSIAGRIHRLAELQREAIALVASGDAADKKRAEALLKKVDAMAADLADLSVPGLPPTPRD